MVGTRLGPRLATMTVCAVVVLGCTPPAPPTIGVSLTIATGGRGGSFYPLGERLSRAWAARIPGVTTYLETGASGANVDALETGQAQVAFAQADVAYSAYRLGTAAHPTPHTQLRGMAVLWTNTVQLVVPRTSEIREPAHLRGRRVAVGSRSSGSETLSRIVLETFALGPDDLQLQFLSFQETIDGLRSGSTDAALISAGVPTTIVADLNADPGLRLVPIARDRVRAMRAHYPFLQPLVVPAGTYLGLDAPVDTVGVSILLACHRDLPEQIVYQMTRLLFEALPEMYEALPVARLIDLEQAPATPIPLHPGAARYYRQREITQ